jgi:hypothetical protein
MSLNASQLIKTANVIAYLIFKNKLALFRKSKKLQDASTIWI